MQYRPPPRTSTKREVPINSNDASLAAIVSGTWQGAFDRKHCGASPGLRHHAQTPRGHDPLITKAAHAPHNRSRRKVYPVFAVGASFVPGPGLRSMGICNISPPGRMSMSAGPDRHHAPAWQALAETLRGRLLLKGDPDYEQRRRVWNGAIDRHPLAIARCADAEDVRAVVRFASREQIPVTVRGGGHNVAGLAAQDDALMLDLGLMNRVEVDPASRTVRVEGGALWRDVDAATQPHGLATTGGFVSTTGIGGYTLGGGVGWLMRRCGLAIDNLIEADVVLTDGRDVVASEQKNGDLFWALRGGAGGLGVVTHFTYRLHAVGEVLAGVVFHPIDAAAGLLRVFRDVTSGVSNELTAMLVFTTAPPLPFLPPEVHGRRVIVLAYCWSGEATAGKRVCAPLADWGQPLGRHEGVMPYAAWQQTFDPTAPTGDHYYWTTSQFDALDDGLIESLLPHAIAPADPFSEVHVHHLGGAVAAIPAQSTAFSQREATFFINVIGRTANAERFDAVRAWVRALRAGLAPFARTGMQPNFTFEATDLATLGHSSATRARLDELRKHYDPNGLLISAPRA
ncbi:FAD-binding oxidoreductase [Dyella solisilvae]|uniref:FAD-binding oxidoreductase n=1 Tax=Dyella solisilvae TaxID=1920168 RepID=A0A370KBE2_9GAMM|nr:FAD-binding oxidoreductase [Dyella solisilvae]RDI99370.1 FAD-binding oxidoreductase [Dyella solisilvae]